MVLKLYAWPTSGNARRVATILHEKQVPFELIPIDKTTRQHKSPEHLAKQPFGQVPFIDDDGFILYESRAICRYICAKYASQGTPLIPDVNDLQATAKLDEAASIEVSHFDYHGFAALYEAFFKTNRGFQPDMEAAKKHLELLESKLAVYDQILGRQKYLAGNELTCVDLYHLLWGSMIPQIMKVDVMTSDKRPNVARWWKDISSRPSWQAVKDTIQSVEKY